MAEVLGILLALLIAGLAWWMMRLAGAIRRRLARLRPLRMQARRLRGRRLHAARALGRSQADRIAALAAELERTRRALRLAERERDALRARRALDRPSAAEDRFRRAKRAFALHFHPDRIRCDGLEARLRRRLFQEFWAELRRIERS